MDMKLNNVLTILLIIAVTACSHKEDHQDHQAAEQAATSTKNWEAMDEFHKIMAEAFHPYKDSANLVPAIQIAEAMAMEAEEWIQAPLPTEVDNAEIKNKLQQLSVEATAFVQITKTGDDVKIGESLTKLHDIFHELQEAWYDKQAPLDHH